MFHTLTNGTNTSYKCTTHSIQHTIVANFAKTRNFSEFCSLQLK